MTYSFSEILSCSVFNFFLNFILRLFNFCSLSSVNFLMKSALSLILAFNSVISVSNSSTVLICLSMALRFNSKPKNELLFSFDF